MFTRSRLLSAVILMMALAACSTPSPSPSVSTPASSDASVAPSASEVASTSPAESAAPAAWPGVAGEVRDRLLELGAVCGTQDETAAGFDLTCGLSEGSVEATVNFSGASDGSLGNLQVVLFDTLVSGFADANDADLRELVIDIASPLFASTSLPVIGETLANYWSFAGTGTSITPPDSDVTFTFTELTELMPADSTIILDFAPSEESAATTDDEGFAFLAAGVLDYYREQSFECNAPQEDIVVDHQWTNCAREADGVRESVTLTVDDDGNIADAIASVSRSDGGRTDADVALSHLRGFMGAMLGDNATEAADWVEENLGTSLQVEETFEGLEMIAYTGTTSNSNTMVVQVSTPEYSSAYDEAG